MVFHWVRYNPRLLPFLCRFHAVFFRQSYTPSCYPILSLIYGLKDSSLQELSKNCTAEHARSLPFTHNKIVLACMAYGTYQPSSTFFWLGDWCSGAAGAYITESEGPGHTYIACNHSKRWGDSMALLASCPGTIGSIVTTSSDRLLIVAKRL